MLLRDEHEAALMIRERSILGAYWGPRPASLEACAEKVARTLDRLGEASVILRTWYRQGRTKSEALAARVEPDASHLRTLLEQGRNVTDVGDRVIKELGYSLSAWNGRDEPYATFSTQCGGWSHWVSNSFVVDLPSPSGIGTELYEPRVARTLIHTLIEVWEPDWATFASRSMRVGEQERQRGGPRVGWLTYLSPRFGDIPSIPPPATIEAVQGKGVVIVAAPMCNDVTPSIVEQLAETLRSYGVFSPAR